MTDPKQSWKLRTVLPKNTRFQRWRTEEQCWAPVLNMIRVRFAIQPDSPIQIRIWIGLDWEKSLLDQIWIS